LSKKLIKKHPLKKRCRRASKRETVWVVEVKTSVLRKDRTKGQAAGKQGKISNMAKKKTTDGSNYSGKTRGGGPFKKTKSSEHGRQN